MKIRKVCHSALWVTFNEHAVCSHCMRLTVEGVTIEGQSWLERYLEVDFELERQLIFHLFAGKSVLRKIYFSILENVCKIFDLYLSVGSQNGYILRNSVPVGRELVYFM